jgi:hypothetical protein
MTEVRPHILPRFYVVVYIYVDINVSLLSIDSRNTFRLLRFTSLRILLMFYAY